MQTTNKFAGTVYTYKNIFTSTILSNQLTGVSKTFIAKSKVLSQQASSRTKRFVQAIVQ